VGRKKLKDGVALKHLVWTRITQQHYDRLTQMQGRSRYRNMSELLRDLICNRQVTVYTHDESLDLVMSELTRLRKEINAIGKNLNQITRQVHGNWPPGAKGALVLEAAAQMEEARPEIKATLDIISELAKKWLQE
jgi:hypothetical protein